MVLALLVLAVVALALAAPIAYRRAVAWSAMRAYSRPAVSSELEMHLYDPGRERRAEQRARELLRSCVNAEEWAMYRDLGFIRVEGKRTIPSGPAPYAYLIYPHKPIVSYVPASGR